MSGRAALEPVPLSAADRQLLASLVPPMPTAWHRLNPLTKAIGAAATTLAAVAAGGYLVPIALLAAAVLPAAAVARVTGRLLRAAVLVSLPIAVSVALVSVFTRAGTTVLFTLGPLAATAEGVDFAGRVLARLFVPAAALGLFGLTTDPRALVADLERRGVSPRLAYVASSTLDAVPRLVARAAEIGAAQRARGLDTEGSLRRRFAGVLPLAGPVILSTLTEVEERSLALEARAFGRPGRRHPLWTLPDRPAERAARWAMSLAVLALIACRLAGIVPELP